MPVTRSLTRNNPAAAAELSVPAQTLTTQNLFEHNQTHPQGSLVFGKIDILSSQGSDDSYRPSSSLASSSTGSEDSDRSAELDRSVGPLNKDDQTLYSLCDTRKVRAAEQQPAIYPQRPGSCKKIVMLGLASTVTLVFLSYWAGYFSKTYPISVGEECGFKTTICTNWRYNTLPIVDQITQYTVSKVFSSLFNKTCEV